MKQANVPCATLQLRNVLLKFALPNTLAWINTRSSLGVGHHYPHAIHHAAHWAWPKWNFMRFYGNNVISDLRKETTSLSTTMLWLDQVMGSIHRDTMNNAWSSNTIQGWDKLNESSACMYVCMSSYWLPVKHWHFNYVTIFCLSEGLGQGINRVYSITAWQRGSTNLQDGQCSAKPPEVYGHNSKP